MGRKRVIAVGRQIGQRMPKIRKNHGLSFRPRISDIPKEVRQKVKGILVAHERWGPQKYIVAADALIKVSAQSNVSIFTLTYMLRRNKTYVNIMRALIARLEEMGKKQSKMPLI